MLAGTWMLLSFSGPGGKVPAFRADMFDGAAFAGKPSAVLDIIRQAQLFEISLECFIVKHGIPGDRGDDFFSDFHI